MVDLLMGYTPNDAPESLVNKTLDSPTLTDPTINNSTVNGITLASDIDLNGHKVISSIDPVAGTDLATKQYVDTFAAGVDFHQAVRVAADGPINISSPPAVIDGITMVNGDRILLFEQTNPIENGIYVFGPTLVRSTDNNATGELVIGSSVFVTRGIVNGGEQWVVTYTSDNPWVPDTSSTTWVQNAATPSLGTTVVNEQTYGQNATAGVQGTVSRSDHTHGTPPLTNSPASTQAIGDSATSGSSALPARSDHKHGLPAFGSVNANTAFGTMSSNGSASTISRSDHNHGLPSISGDFVAVSGALTLENTGVTPGTYSYPNVTVDAKGRVLSIANQSPNVVPASTVVQKSGDTMTGHLSVPSIAISGTLAEKSFLISFAANTANQKVDLYTTSAAALDTLFDVVLAGSNGVISKRYTVTSASATTLSEQTTRYNEVMGSLGQNLALSDVTYDAINNRWHIQIVQRNPQSIVVPLSVNLRIMAPTAIVSSLLGSFGVSSVYTTDTTIFPSAVFSFSGSVSATSLLTNFRTTTVNTTLGDNDSILIANAGVTVTLPSAIAAGKGRQYSVKNLQQSVVTVVSVAGTIDTATSFSVGNKQAYTFISDGSVWWILSMFK
jgi:hypothetical protein